MSEIIIQIIILAIGLTFIFTIMVPEMRKAFGKLPAVTFNNDDPTRLCQCYVEKGCSHIDGMHCDMKSCTILEEYRKEHGR